MTQLNASKKNAQPSGLPAKRIQNANQPFKTAKTNARLIKTAGNGASSVLETNLPSMLLNALLPTTALILKLKLTDSNNACKNHANFNSRDVWETSCAGYFQGC